MKNKTVWIAGGILLLAGVSLVSAGKALGGVPGIYVDRYGVHSPEEEPLVYVQDKKNIQPFEELSVQVDYADINLIPADDYYVEYTLDGQEGEPEIVSEDGTLHISQGSEGRFGFYIMSVGIFGGVSDSAQKREVNIYYPEETPLHSISLDTQDGEITMGKATVETLAINNSYGEVQAGEIMAEKAEIAMKDGDLSVERMECESLSLVNDYGHVEVKELECEKGMLRMNDGDLEVGTAAVGQLQIENDYGEVRLLVPRWKEITLNLETKYGDIFLPDSREEEKEDGGSVYIPGKDEEKELVVISKDGDIIIQE